jgi:hypothetical protein
MMMMMMISYQYVELPLEFNHTAFPQDLTSRPKFANGNQAKSLENDVKKYHTI